MSAPLVIPFNFDSGTTSLKTSSYTVGAGKYCYARPLSVSCTVNSTLVFLTASSQSYTSGSGTTYRYLGAHHITGRLTAANAATSIGVISIAGNFHALATGDDLYITNGMVRGGVCTAVTAAHTMNPGLYIQTTGAWAVAFFSGFLYESWYKEGDVLTGGYWFVTEYNSVT